MEMMFLTNDSVAREWMSGLPEMPEIFDLASAVEFPPAFLCRSPKIAN
jgi:hypothetical protein